LAESRPTIRLWELFLSLGVFVILVFYAVTALSSADLMWFWPQSSVPQPSRIVIHNQGQERELTAEMAEFEPIAEAAAQVFSRLDTVALIEVGLSDVTLGLYWNDAVVVEFFYEEPIQFHVPFQAGRPTQLLLPVKGPHADKGLFFRGALGQYWFGAMRVRDPETLLKALEPYTS